VTYVPIEYPKVLYSADGLPVTVKNAASAALLPLTFASAPTAIGALVAFPPSLVARIVSSLPAVLPPILQAVQAVRKRKGEK
jgi:hypothetical protein